MKLPNQSKCGFLAFIVMFCGVAMAQNGKDAVPQTSGLRRAYAYGFVGGGGLVPKFVQEYTYSSYPQVLNQGTREVTAAVRFGVGGGARITRNLYGRFRVQFLERRRRRRGELRLHIQYALAWIELSHLGAKRGALRPVRILRL